MTEDQLAGKKDDLTQIIVIIENISFIIVKIVGPLIVNTSQIKILISKSK